jgi:hypothetical protein
MENIRYHETLLREVKKINLFAWKQVTLSANQASRIECAGQERETLMRNTFLITAGLILSIATAGCKDPFFKPSVRPIERALGATIPVGYAATLAMSAFQGHPTQCVNFSTDCAEPPCGGLVNIMVNQDCPLPLSENAEGMITVTGALTSADTGLFAAVFSEVSEGNRKLMLQKVKAFVVTRFNMNRSDPDAEDSNIKVIMYDLDIELTPPETMDVGQAMYLIDVDTNKTPGDPSDDYMTINGVRQGAQKQQTTAGASQTVLAQVGMNPKCRKNPVMGFGIIESADTSRIADNGITMLAFTPNCTGEALILLSVGLAAPSSTTSVKLNLLAD